MLDYLLVFSFQVAFNFLKVLEIQLSYEGRTAKLLVVTVLLSVLALLSTFYSLTLLFDGDWAVILLFVSGSVLGKWAASTFFKSNYRKELYEKLQKKKQKQNKKATHGS